MNSKATELSFQDGLPPYDESLERRTARRHHKRPRKARLLLTVAILFLLTALCNLYLSIKSPLPGVARRGRHPRLSAAEIQARRATCAALHVKPGPPPDFHRRSVSDRFVPGTPPTLLRNATIWLGGDDSEVLGLQGDVFLSGGLIKGVGVIHPSLLAHQPDLVVYDLHGAWVTPGIVDLHSHLGVDSVPALNGASDTNSINGPTQPWLRSLDGLNTHDAAYELSISGGVTSALVLPGSADNIGGQAFMIKLRKTAERSSSAMVVEPPWGLWNGSHADPELPMRWRHMKHACGENPSRVYRSTRMDSIYRFRAIYAAAEAVRDAQDAYCTKVEDGDWEDIADQQFPYDLQLEALVDTLRGRVKVNVHCYEAVDFDGIVRLTNEFKFPVAAFHHAHEAYLVPDLIKKTWGGAPAIAMFATNARYKRESYRGSEFAPKILSEAGIPVVMKSDHPVLNSRFLLYEAQQAYHYGLNASLALESVTSTPAKAAGFSHRLGAIKVGHDADIVVWDSHPLQLGAAPLQVWIDGITQLSSPNTKLKSSYLQHSPDRPDFSLASEDALAYEGDPPLGPKKVFQDVVFLNVRTIRRRTSNGDLAEFVDSRGPTTVVVRSGLIACVGHACEADLKGTEDVTMIDLEGGALEPGLATFGSPLGLEEIRAEPSTNDGVAYDLLTGTVPSVLDGNVLRAADGLQFGGKDALLAYRAGVTLAVTPPASYGFLSGISAAFSTGAAMKSEQGSVIQAVAALHVDIGHRGSQPSISAQVAALRSLLSGANDGTLWAKAALGDIPLIIHVDKADIIATLILLKEEIDIQTGKHMRLSFAGASEAHLLAKNIADARVGVILSPARPFVEEWDQRRTLPGPPLTEETNLSVLRAHNVTTAVGIVEAWQARSTRFDAIWTYREAFPKMSKNEVLAMFTTNLETLLGVENTNDENVEMVAYSGGDVFEPSATVVGVIRGGKGAVELF